MANKTSFQAGHKPWNANRRVEVNCKGCGKTFSVPLFRLNAKSVSCSRRCSRTCLSRQGLAEETMRLVSQGKTAQEIAAALKRPVTTIYSHVNRRKYRFRQPGLSRSAITNTFLRDAACAVCGWTRCLDAAHITPASKGGTMEESNLLPLCPNHHRLFDKGRLTTDELYRIEEYRRARRIA